MMNPAVRRSAIALALLSASLVSAALLAAPAQAEPTRYPLTVRNCGVDVSFDKAPGRVVSVGQSTTEILLSLGLADRLVGTAVWFTPVMKRYEAENARIRRLADNDPSFESVVAQAPDLVTAQFEWHVGPNGAVGTRDQFARLGIPAYVSPADCVKDNSGAGDGVRKQLFTMDLVYQGITELAAIFDVQDRGTALVGQLKAREAAALASVAGVKAKDVSVVFWFSSKEVRGEAFAAGRNGTPAYLAATLGLRNVITTEEEWPLVSWETIAATDPAIIVIADMSRRRYAADDPAVKRAFLESDPVTSRLDAVRNHRILVLDSQAMSPTIRATDGIEALAAGIGSFGLLD